MANDALQNIFSRTRTFVNREEVDVRPTFNERNTSMLSEATTYSQALRALCRELTSWSKNTDVGLNSVSTLLQTPLPRVFDNASNGAAFPVRREHKVIGNDVRLDQLASARRELIDKLQRDVLTPLALWQDALKKIREENQKVEELRAELDTQRTRHARAAQQHERTAAAPTAKPQAVEESAARLQQEEDKAARLSARYQELEASVYQAVFALIQDVHVLRDYAAAAITLMQNAFTTALCAFQLPAYIPDWTLPEGMAPQQAEALAQTRPRTRTLDACTVETPTASVPAAAPWSVRSAASQHSNGSHINNFSRPVSAMSLVGKAPDLGHPGYTGPVASVVVHSPTTPPA